MKAKWLVILWVLIGILFLSPLQQVIASADISGKIDYNKNQLTPTLEQGAKKNPAPGDPDYRGGGDGDEEGDDDKGWFDKVVDKVKKETEDFVDTVKDAGSYIKEKTSDIVDATTEWWNERSLLEKSLIIVGVIATVVTLGAAAGVISAGAALTMGVMGAANYALYASTTDNVSFWGGLMWGGLGMVGGGIGLAAKGAKFLAPARAVFSGGRFSSLVPAALRGSRAFPMIRAVVPGALKGAAAGSGLSVYTNMAKWAITGEPPTWGEIGHDALVWGASGAVAGSIFRPAVNVASKFMSKGKAIIAGASSSAGSESIASDFFEGKSISLKRAAIAASAVVVIGGAGVLAPKLMNSPVKQAANTTEVASETVGKTAKAEDGVSAAKASETEEKAAASANGAVNTKPASKTTEKTGPLALDLQYFNSKTASKTSVESNINQKTSPQIKAMLKEKGIDDVYFQSLLPPERKLSTSEKALVSDIRGQLSSVSTDTIMQKVIPEQDIYQYLYNPKFSGTRGFVTTRDHAESLISIEDIYNGLRLDYNQTAYKMKSGIDTISSRVGPKDQFYGVFHYKADPEILAIPNDLPTPENFPYTGKGYSGSNTDIIPEFTQGTKDFVKGDLFLTKDRKGNVQYTFLYDEKKKGWRLVE